MWATGIWTARYFGIHEEYKYAGWGCVPSEERHHMAWRHAASCYQCYSVSCCEIITRYITFPASWGFCSHTFTLIIHIAFTNRSFTFICPSIPSAELHVHISLSIVFVSRGESACFEGFISPSVLAAWFCEPCLTWLKDVGQCLCICPFRFFTLSKNI